MSHRQLALTSVQASTVYANQYSMIDGRPYGVLASTIDAAIIARRLKDAIKGGAVGAVVGDAILVVLLEWQLDCSKLLL